MKVKLLSILLVMFTGASSFNGSDLASIKTNQNQEREQTNTKLGLHLLVELDSENCRLGQATTVRVRLKNIATSSILIYKHLGWGRSSSFSLDITDLNGQWVIPPFIPDTHHSPPFKPEDFVAIAPEDAIQVQRILDLKSNGITKPGIYKVIVRYHSPIPNELAPKGLEIWGGENWVLKSEPIILRVKKALKKRK